MYKGTNLLTLGGVNDSDKCRRIALTLFSTDGLKKVVIDPRRAPPSRERADEERTDSYRKAVRNVLGPRYTEDLYRYLLNLTNQIGLNIKDNEKSANKENCTDVEQEKAQSSQKIAISGKERETLSHKTATRSSTKSSCR